MFEAIKLFFDSLVGVTLPDEIYTILAFALASWLVGAFVGIFSRETRRVWNWSIRLCLILMAVLFGAQYVGLQISAGGIF